MRHDRFSSGWAITAGVLVCAALIAAAADATFAAGIVLIFAAAAVAVAAGSLPHWTGGGPS